MRGSRAGRFLVPVVVVGLLIGSAAMSGASPPSGVTPTLIARGTYPEFKVKSERHGDVDFQAISRAPIDVVVRRHAYAPGGYTGWHSHPGPVLITVTNRGPGVPAGLRGLRSRAFRAQRERPGRRGRVRDHGPDEPGAVPRRAGSATRLRQLTWSPEPTDLRATASA